MPLFHLKRVNDIFGLDEVDAFVIRADNHTQARQLASKRAGGEGPDVWLDNTLTSSLHLKPEGGARVIVRSFNAG